MGVVDDEAVHAPGGDAVPLERILAQWSPTPVWPTLRRLNPWVRGVVRVAGGVPLLWAVLSLAGGVPGDDGVRRRVLIGAAAVLVLVGVALVWVEAGRAVVGVPGTMTLGQFAQQRKVMVALWCGLPVDPQLRLQAATRVAVQRQLSVVAGLAIAASAALVVSDATEAHVPQLGDVWPAASALLVWLALWSMSLVIVRHGAELGVVPVTAEPVAGSAPAAWSDADR